MSRQVKSILSLVLVAAMLVSMTYFPVTIAWADGTIVYVADIGNNSNAGTSAADPVATLQKAYEILGDAGGTIVVCGPLTISSDFNADDGISHTGMVMLTSKTSTEDYTAAAHITFNVDKMVLGGPTVWENITLTVSKTATLYVPAFFTVDSTVTMGGAAAFTIYGGYNTKNCTEDITMTLNGGTYTSVLTGGKSFDVGDVDLTVGGTATITSNITVGSATTADAISITVNEGAQINAFYDSPRTGGSVGSVDIKLLGGAFTKINTGLKDYSGASTINGDISVTLDAAFVAASGSVMGQWGSSVTCHGATKTLTLVGFTGEKATIAEGYLNAYTDVVLDNSSGAIYASSLPAGLKTLTVKEGSSLKLSHYTAAPDGVTISGTVTYAEPEVPGTEVDVVYVASAGSDDNAGDSAAAPVATLQKAYNSLDKTKGGTIVVSGPLNITSSFNTDDAISHTGTVTVTSKLGAEDYTESAALNFTAANGFLVLGGPTVWKDLKASIIDSAYLCSTTSFTVESTVLMGNTGPTLFAGYYSKDCTEGVTMTVNGGTFKQVLAGGNVKSSPARNVKNVNVTIGGTAFITSNITAGSTSTAGDISITVNEGARVNAFYDSPQKGGSVGSMDIKLLGGAFTRTSPLGLTDYTGASTINGDIKVTLNAGFIAPTGSAMGLWGSNVTFNGTSKTLTLLGFTGEKATIAEGYLNAYTDVVLDDSAGAVYESSLPAGLKTLTVKEGSSLKLSNYTAAPDGVTISGNVSYSAPSTTIEVDALTIYVDGSKAAGGDGKTPATAVKTLDEAYQLLLNSWVLDTGKNVKENADTPATIVISGPVTQETSFNVNATYSHAGTITITSVYAGTDYRTTSGAKLVVGIVDSSAHVNFQLASTTIIDDMTIDRVNTSTSQHFWIYTGYDLTIGSGFLNTQNGVPINSKDILFAIRAGFFTADKYDGTTPLNITLNGGYWRNVNCGSESHNITGATLNMGANSVIGSYIECGGVYNTHCGPITINIEKGAIINALYLYSYATDGNPTVESLTVNNAGSIYKILPQRGKITTGSTAITGNLVINLLPTGVITGTGTNYVLENAYNTVGGKVILNKTHFNGSALEALTQYDVVNLFGSNTIPGGFDQMASGSSGRVLQVNGYTGVLDQDLSIYSQLKISGDSNVTLFGSYPKSLPVDVEAGSTLRLRATYNTTANNYPTNKTGSGIVIIEEPLYGGTDPVLHVDFNDENAKDSSGKNNNGVITGNPSFVTGADGSKAIYIKNTFGKSASQYVTFSDLKGVNLPTDDFTVTFWYKSVAGGSATKWASSSRSTAAGAKTDFSTAKEGGIIFANKDYSVNTNSGFAAANMPFYTYFTTNLTDNQGELMDTTGTWQAVDDRWHQVSVVYDRDGSCAVYVDDKLINSISISEAEGEMLGQNLLTLGADALGQYGLANAYIDDLTIYPSALNYIDVQAVYGGSRLKAMNAEIDQRLVNIGTQYATDSISALKAKNAAAKIVAAAAIPNTYATSKATYDELRAAYESFLLSPAAKVSMMLLSDLHVTSEGDAATGHIQKALADPDILGLKLDGIVNAGDFANTATKANSNAAFAAIKPIAESKDWQFLTSLGNHEINYDSPTANFMNGAVQYWSNIQAYIGAENAEDKIYGKGVLDDFQNYSYGMTINDYHFLVINTDYLEQTGVTTEESTPPYPDPIRHGAYFEDETLAWIDSMLAQYSEDGKPTFVICHFPFINTVPLSSFNDNPILDNSIGKQDAEVRNLLGKYDNIIYMSGHLHHGFGAAETVTVKADTGTFTEITIPSFKANVRGYSNLPASMYLFTYEDEVVLRARDFSSGEWLTEYDMVIPITGTSDNGGGDNGGGDNGSGSGNPNTPGTGTTVTNPDGSRTTTVTNSATGTTTVTTVYVDGSKTIVETKKDGSTSISTTVSSETIKNGAVTLRVPAVTAADSADSASALTLTLPEESGDVTVSIPLMGGGSGVVTVLVDKDGNETIVKNSVVIDQNLIFTASGSIVVKVVDNSKTFTDVSANAGYSDNVNFVTSRELYYGTSGTTFSPDTPMTRGMLMTVLARLDGQNTLIGETSFSIGIEWAMQQGISDGKSPDNAVTREQMVSMLYRYAGSPSPSSQDIANTAKFKDAGEISNFAKDAMAWAIAKGIIVGGTDGTLNPGGVTTRAQVAAVCQRYLNYQ